MIISFCIGVFFSSKEVFWLKKEDVLKLKSEPSIVTYIQLLQSNIARMSSHSGIIKASICVVYTILITILIGINKINHFWWIAIFITLIGSIIDAYYLAMEKIYVKKYNDFIAKLNKDDVNEFEVYDMKPRNTDLKNELLAMTITSMTSFSVYGFYSLFIIISILIKFV